MDAPTRFCYQWLQQHGFASGPFGDAETLSQGLNTGMNTIAEQDGIITSARGLVQLVSIDEYGSSRSNPRSERPGTAWEGCFRMAYHMQQGDEYDGEEGAAKVLNDILDRRIPVDADAIERLARILIQPLRRQGHSPRRHIQQTCRLLADNSEQSARTQGRQSRPAYAVAEWYEHASHGEVVLRHPVRPQGKHTAVQRRQHTRAAIGTMPACTRYG